LNYFAQDLLGSPQALLWSALIGLAFGFWLERAGFGSSRKLTAIFYLRDFAVLQVMFTAIVTTSLGLLALALLGLVDIAQLYRMETMLAPQIVGGLVFGVGFVMGGWCPGTALVGLAAGKGDALVFLLGAMLGSLAFAFAYPALVPFQGTGSCGVLALPEVLGLSPGVVTLLVVAVALAAFAVAGRVVRARTLSSPPS
jgi:uncharacterized membrane protein YedE/YeeE